MRASFGYFVNLFRRYPLFGQVALGTSGRDHLETKRAQKPHGVEDALLVGVSHRYEHGPRAWQPRAAPDLAFDEGHFERMVDTHDLAGRLHLRSEHGIDAREAGEREHCFLHADMVEAWRLEAEALECLAGHDARRDLSDRPPDHLGDERHRAGSARIDPEHIDVAVLDGVFDVHEAADIERKRKLAGLAAELVDGLLVERVRRQRAGRVAGMDAGFLDVLHDAGDHRLLAVGEAVDVDLDGVGEIAVEQQRALRRHHKLRRPVEIAGEPRDVAVELRAVVHDLHGAAAQHIGRPDHDRIADLLGDRARLFWRLGDAALRLA